MNSDPQSPNPADEAPTPPDECLHSSPSPPDSPASERDAEIQLPADDLEYAKEEVIDEVEAEKDAWKEALRRDFEAWLESVDEIPAMDDPLAPGDPPDICSFFELLAVANAESRKANRRTAEAFSQWGDTLGRFDQELHGFRDQLGRLAADQPKDGSLSRPHALVLIELLDRLQRLARAFQSAPPKSWWTIDTAWRKVWETQRQACDILASHFEAFLAREGITRIDTLNQSFDPAIMSAVAAEPDPERPHHTIIEEISAGYHCQGELLRPAQVKVTLNKTDATPS